MPSKSFTDPALTGGPVRNKATCQHAFGFLAITLATIGSLMSALFRKARQNRIFQDVVDQIQSAILDGRLKMGDKLPAERELGDMLGTSRGTLREALRVLEQKGLIEIRLGVGGGAIAKGPGGDQITESLDMLIRSQKVSLHNLAEFREGVEGTVAGLAAQRAKPEDIKLLHQLLEAARRCWETGVDKWRDFVRVDEQMHMTLAQVARNPVYALILKTVHDNIHTYYDRFLPCGKDELNENYQDLKQLVEAVVSGQVEKSSELARDHVRRFNRYMEKKKREIGT
jgi:GntR family transcriptional repressor for pyruvate dehydrogenase complex